MGEWAIVLTLLLWQTGPLHARNPVPHQHPASEIPNATTVNDLYASICEGTIPGNDDKDDLPEKKIEDLSGIKIGGNTNNARTKLFLPHRTAEGSRIRWSSDSPDSRKMSLPVI
jgi:hypothetical protein